MKCEKHSNWIWHDFTTCPACHDLEKLEMMLIKARTSLAITAQSKGYWRPLDKKLCNEITAYFRKKNKAEFES